MSALAVTGLIGHVTAEVFCTPSTPESVGDKIYTLED